MAYISFGQVEVNLDCATPQEIIDLYDAGYVFTRIRRGLLTKIRSLRVRLDKFDESSENRRILKKYRHVITFDPLPLAKMNSDILILAKNFYDSKFGKNIFSAYKIKEILSGQNNFNLLLRYSSHEVSEGYCICRVEESNQEKIVHYAYPFYSLNKVNSNFGMFMMTKAVKFFKENNYKYIYLGSCHDSKSKYKLQFKGIEWFSETENSWQNDIQKLKSLIEPDS